ncbi:metal-dependent phosphohydrolase [Pseudomonas phage vB_Pae10145-KEN51]|uniref:PHIKZ246 n=4 Tax=Phikzvirus TaxID=680115 RepID=Q8SCR6_BPDPK|nr:HD domain-containing protein [Pseudomonas aeruginosa]NP_803812.1 metal-dependent phosphohydrolase [Pseudomonas phage phiKZ]YP_009617399.1 metal-dependent phosphohydrolase [Pseudomonas phage PA7]YP_009619622.1 metal-dependent phosphohydrolase [Pseudomonas phage SL2]ANM45056.1 hypothetical protein KTN4_298 [Pseudomonas phage KTN4]QGK89925.1 hypothetical protein [Pseudomonas phage vB_PA32_GUMS]QOV08143.1 hypothetical protein [Pseudomonas phage vB_PaeM_kmuB]QYV99058.1 hypothetical protein [Ps
MLMNEIIDILEGGKENILLTNHLGNGKYSNAGNAMAASYAIAAHTAVGQLRDGSGKPYWHHLLQVAEMAQLFDLSHAAYKAAWLHDVIEDTAVTASDLTKLFSIPVVNLVTELTNVTYEGNRKTRISLQHERLSRISWSGQSLKLLDSISNMWSIVNDKPDFAELYLTEKAQLISKLNNCHPAIKDLAISVLYGRCTMVGGDALKEYNKLFSDNEIVC